MYNNTGIRNSRKQVFLAVLKRLFEYSNIFEQGFENEYSNTKIENRVFEKAMNIESSSVADTAASRHCVSRAAGGRREGYAVDQAADQLPLIMNANCGARSRSTSDSPFDRSRFLRSPPCSARSCSHEAPVDVRLRWAFLFHTLSLASAKLK